MRLARVAGVERRQRHVLLRELLLHGVQPLVEHGEHLDRLLDGNLYKFISISSINSLPPLPQLAGSPRYVVASLGISHGVASVAVIRSLP